MSRIGKYQFSASPYHPDVPLFLVLIPFISAINYYLTYSGIRLNGFLLLTFSIDTVQGYLAWLGVRWAIIHLDKKMPYRQGPGRRIAVQLIITTFLGLFIISILTELVSWLARGKPAPWHFYTRDLFIIGIWFFVVNGVYIGLYFYREWQGSEARRKEESRLKSEGLVVSLGKQELRLRFEDLAGFFVDEGHVMACDTGGRKYFQDQSLDSIEKMLPSALFFRLNRQFILHRQMIAGFKRNGNGKIMVMLNDSELFPSVIPVSRTKAPAFKSWFKPG